ncbi:hypothetical protein FGO68_gene16810 [Halteria grandinella]|uniref:Uncharacterized protein n=1 Tax=Halteria grandinella TaxID=5974 RepID=A0A8J8T4M9_HALGN|nr:hypothetical protein FGO68_gene16810 [Halteria grandinella]
MIHGEISRDNLSVYGKIARLGKFQSHNETFKLKSKADDVHDLGLILGDDFKEVKDIMQDSSNIQDAFRIKQIRDKIEQITEEEVLGPEIAKQVKQKMVNYGVFSSTSGHTLPYDQTIDPQIYEHYQSIISDQYNKNQSESEAGGSKLLQSINTYGWYRQIIYGNKIWQKIPFNGEIESTGKMMLKEGVYCGQTEHGKRDGYGILFAVTTAGEPVLYECDWKDGNPVYGRRTIETKGTYFKYEGDFSEWIEHSLSNCTLFDGNGNYFMNGWLNSDQHWGIYHYADGSYASGDFLQFKKHGYI